MEFIEALLRVILAAIGRPLRLLLGFVDLRPRRDPSRLAAPERAGRLILAVAAGAAVLLPFAWLVLR
jgi:hypothetical protein